MTEDSAFPPHRGRPKIPQSGNSYHAEIAGINVTIESKPLKLAYNDKQMLSTSITLEPTTVGKATRKASQMTFAVRESARTLKELLQTHLKDEGYEHLLFNQSETGTSHRLTININSHKKKRDEQSLLTKPANAIVELLEQMQDIEFYAPVTSSAPTFMQLLNKVKKNNPSPPKERYISESIRITANMNPLRHDTIETIIADTLHEYNIQTYLTNGEADIKKVTELTMQYVDHITGETQKPAHNIVPNATNKALRDAIGNGLEVALQTVEADVPETIMDDISTRIMRRQYATIRNIQKHNNGRD